MPVNEPAQLNDIQDSIQHLAGSQAFTEAELKAAFDQLSDENIIFLDQDLILLLWFLLKMNYFLLEN